MLSSSCASLATFPYGLFFTFLMHGDLFLNAGVNIHS